MIANDALLARIQALRAKTTERGCTEQEAMAAAAKVAELLDRHGLTLTELEIRSQPCEQVTLDTDRSRIGPFDECAPAVAAFFDCRFWFSKDPEGRLRHVFFGLPVDVQASVYLMSLIGHAFETESDRFRRSAEYLRGRSGGRRALHTSFIFGMSQGVQAKLASMRAERETAFQTSGRDLVLVKSDVVEAEMAKLGMRFRTRKPASRMIHSRAFDAGHAAGERFEPRPGLN